MSAPYHILYVQPYGYKSGPHQSLYELISNLDRTQFVSSVVLREQGPASDDFADLGASVYFDCGIKPVLRSISPFRQSRFLAPICDQSAQCPSALSPPTPLLCRDLPMVWRDRGPGPPGHLASTSIWSFCTSRYSPAIGRCQRGQSGTDDRRKWHRFMGGCVGSAPAMANAIPHTM